MLHGNRLLSQELSVLGNVPVDVSVRRAYGDEHVAPDEARGELKAGYQCMVVVAYEDLSSGRRAVELVLRLSQQVPELRFDLRPWRFDLLNQPACQHRAVSDGAQAELLIVSSRGGNSLAEGVETWLTRTLARKPSGTAAVVALLGAEARRDTPDLPGFRFVERAAKAAGLDFFGPALGDEPATSAGFGEASGAQLSAPRFHEEFQPALPFRDWGINE